VDSASNLYVADSGNNRIRRFTQGGVASTVAGNGSRGSTGDGGSALSASLSVPVGIAVDTTGVMFISEESGNRIRRVGTDGIMSTWAGTGTAGFAGDGGPASAALLQTPGGLALDRAGDLYIADAANDRVRVVQVVLPSYQISTSALSISVKSGGDLSPNQGVALTPSLAGIPYTTSVSFSGGGQWLQVTPANGSMPATLQMRADPSAVPPGAYQANVTVTAPNAIPPVSTVKVSLQVAAPDPPKLAVDATSVPINTYLGAPDVSVPVNVRNAGGGTVQFTTTSAVTTGSNWLNVSPGSGSASPSQPFSLTVTVSPGKLAVGTYSGTIHLVSAGANTIDVPVVISVAQSRTKILLTQVGLTFTAVAQGGSLLPQTIGVLNAGSGPMDWSAQANPLSGQNWLSLSKTSGSVQSALTDLSPFDVLIDASKLGQGEYFGQIAITSPGASNSPQYITIVVNVLATGSKLGPDVQPSTLIFTGSVGASPSSQNLSISNPAGGSISYTSQHFTDDGNPWLAHVPSNANLANAAAAKVVVQPDYTGFSVGTHTGSIVIQFSDGTVRTVNVLTIASLPGSGRATEKGAYSMASDHTVNVNCKVPVQIQVLSPASKFTAIMGQGTPFLVKVLDCDNNLYPASDVRVSLGFPTGEQQVNLNAAPDGSFSNTWTAKNSALSGINVIAGYVSGNTHLTNAQHLDVTVGTGSRAPLTFGIGNAASGIGTYIAPGGLVSVYGDQLADQPGNGGTPPFPTKVNGTQILLGGIPMPLRYVGGGQINAQVPFGLNVATDMPLMVLKNDAESVPQNVTVAATQPAVYTQDQSGTGPGVIVNGVTNQLITSASPAKVGDVLVIYCNGLGAVNPAVPSGTPAPLGGPLSNTVNPVTVTIGGQNARVDFAGLAPGYPDLYQVNAAVLAGTPAGNQPVVLSAGGQVRKTPRTHARVTAGSGPPSMR
jgi:uncharacterized protein (TIGR03437 family)